ncbi:hypothetical protein [Pseudomonas fluorescens]|uniref:hypothetical protein n=1 Tax=Pseudomonas fluorescens TaxID=294 RepID=UPI00128C649B|nr:hypothetical protein [Pseudomonas fluorescens]
MTTAAKYSIAFRLGRGFGAAVRFCSQGETRATRWAKRLIGITVTSLALCYALSWILAGLLLLVAGWFVVVAVSSTDTPSQSQAVFDAPSGRDVFGGQLDSWGKRTDGHSFIDGQD